MEEDELFNMCVGFLIVWCKPIFEVTVSYSVPSKLVLSLEHQFRGFELILPNTSTKNGLQ